MGINGIYDNINQLSANESDHTTLDVNQQRQQCNEDEKTIQDMYDEYNLALECSKDIDPDCIEDTEKLCKNFEALQRIIEKYKTYCKITVGVACIGLELAAIAGLCYIGYWKWTHRKM